MKVLIISTSDLAGGAAISACRLHQGLLAAGVESRMLVRQKCGSDDLVTEFPTDKTWDFDWQASVGLHVTTHARSGASNTTFSLPWPGHQVADHPLVEWADVINVHWASGFVSPEELQRLALRGKPLVRTLHDQRPFTGGCHYTDGCEGFVSNCHGCPQLQPAYQPLAELGLQLSLLASSGVPPVTVVSPSRWLASEAKRSHLYSGCPVKVIPYGLPLDVFKPGDKHELRKRLGLPESGLIFIFGAFTLEERRKGFDLLSQAISSVLARADVAAMQQEGRLMFAAYGKDEKTLRKSGLPVKLLGVVDNEPDMAAMLGAADMVICPTREDNLPNVVLEAMACGVPVLSCDVGGVPDMISDGIHGRLVPVNNANALAQAMAEIIHQPEVLNAWGSAARKKCEAEYPLSLQGERYKALLAELLSQAPTHVEGAAVSLADTQTSLLQAMARSQGLEVAALKEANGALASRLREAEQKAAARSGVKAALKIVEEELKNRRNAGLLAGISPAVLALKKVRQLLKHKTNSGA